VRGSRGPRQPGGGKQTAGPRYRSRPISPHPEMRAPPSLEGRRPGHSGRTSFEARLRRAPQDDGEQGASRSARSDRPLPQGERLQYQPRKIVS
jgi:hypothetical protein